MKISANTQTILLLTARFTGGGSGTDNPLTPKEYGRFAEWLRLQCLSPERLLSGSLQKLLPGWHDKTVTVERIDALLDRGSALALSVEKWLSSGLWVIARSDEYYPKRLKHHLRCDSPAVLFGCGRKSLLNAGGLAVVGSRKVSQEDLAYSSKIGELASNAGFSIVSGGARGVDESAMLGALGAGGTAVGVLAESLLRACTSRKYRHALMEDNLVLVSPFNPEAGFSTGNAMARNKYIYCLADTALAIHSGTEGGTWAGARENLKKGWVPLWVKQTNDPEAGNSRLIAAGASEVSACIDEVSIEAFFKAAHEMPDNNNQDPPSSSSTVDLDALPEEVTEKPRNDTDVSNEHTRRPVCKNGTDAADTASEPSVSESVNLSRIPLYDLFVSKVTLLCGCRSRTTDELAEELSLNKTQLNTWLKQAVTDGHLIKLKKPVRYDLVGRQQGLFTPEL